MSVRSRIKSSDEAILNNIAKIQQLTEKEKVQDFFHGIHNYMRNNGIGYSMTGLKIFSLFFGLMSIELKPKCLKLLDFDEQFLFENIIKRCKAYKSDPSKAPSIKKFIDCDLLNYLAKYHNQLFFVELPKELSETVICDFILNKIAPLQKYINTETNSNIQLNGKLYEYFIGREKAIMSELGAYFTDRYVTLYISLKSPIHIREDGTIPINIDMFGGSGGFTIANIEHFLKEAKDKNIKVNWKKEIKKIFHFDMNPDVVKYAAFETFLLLEQHINYDNNFKWSNSFKENFTKLLENTDTDTEVRTNPPYGGDKFDRQVGQIASFIKMVEFINGHITIKLNELFEYVDTTKISTKVEFMKLFNKVKTTVAKQYNDTITEEELNTYINTTIKPIFNSDITEDELQTQLTKLTIFYTRKIGLDNSIKNLETKHKKEDIVSLHTSSKFIKDYNKLIKDYDFNKITSIKDHDFTTNKTYNPNKDNYKSKKYDGPYDKEAVSLILLMASIQKGGRVVGVLKEGVFFNDSYRYLRAYLCCNFEVEYITSIDQKAFENTTTKTSIICFKNTGKPTTSIKFYELLIVKQEEDEIVLDEDCFPIIKRHKGDIINFENNDINEMEEFVSEASFDELIKNEFNLQGKTYEKNLEIIPGDDFKMVKLGDICEFENGRQLDKQNIIKGQYPVFGGGKSYIGKHINFNRDNSIIIAGTGNYSGFVTYYNDKFWASQCFTLKPLNIKNIKLVYYICKLFQDIIMNTNGGTAQKFIRGNNLKKFQIPIPKTDELIEYWTKKIEVPFNKMNEKEEKIKSIEEEIETEIKRIVDEEDCIDTKLGDICEISTGIKTELKSQYTLNADGIPLIRIQNLDGSTKFVKVKKSCLEKYQNKIANIGDILIASMVNKYVQIKIINKYLVNYLINGAILKIKNKNNKLINNNYIYYIIKIFGINMINNANGSIQKNINKNILENFNIPIPKNKEVLKSLDTKFEKLEKVRINFEKYKTQYEDALEELKTASIKSGLN
jgi:restriction endonuclease S subunit